ncbi:MAG: hypothetical protein JJT78_17860 [Leptospira sp.]|nr:hypothetical protein [Leptospira sp.]
MKIVFFILYFLLFSITAIHSEKNTYINEEDYFQYIYVDANTGQSSGGHSALKFGDWVYHFQFYPDDIFHIVRESWFDFRFSYNIQGNRTLEMVKVYPQGESSNFIERGFNQIFLIQEKHLNNWKEMKDDVQLLESSISSDNLYRVEGLGYLSRNSSIPNIYSHKLKLKIESDKGREFFTKEINEIYNRIHQLEWHPNTISGEKFSSRKYPLGYKSLSYNYDNSLRRLGLLEGILESRGLDKATLVYIPRSISKGLEEKERKTLERLQAQLEMNILNNISDGKDSHSYLNLLEFLTYLLIGEMLEKNQFIFMDTFASNSINIRWNEENEIKSLASESYLLFEKYRKLVFSNEFTLQEFMDLQDGANRYIEIASSAESLRSIRHNHAKTLPKLRGLPNKYPKLPWDLNTLKNFHRLALENRNNYKVGLENIYPYQLVLQNCTSEIFFSLDKIFNQDKEKIQEVLGKRIDPLSSLSFIPFYSSYDIKKNYHKTQSEIILSYRRDSINKMKENEKSWKVDARESFVPTSTAYKPNSYDHKFIFFTDDTILLRPFYGLGNLVGGLIYTGLGIPMAPFDEGESFLRGVKGMFFAMPELVFFNINKGTFLYLRLNDLDPEFPNEKQDKTKP